MAILALGVALLLFFLLMLVLQTLRWGPLLLIAMGLTFFISIAGVLMVEGVVLGIANRVREKRGTVVSPGLKRCATVLLALGIPFFVVDLLVLAWVIHNAGWIMSLTSFTIPIG